MQDTEVFTQRRRRAAVALELTKSTTNAALDANSGTRTSLGLRWASPLIGSDSLFHLARIEFEIATYRRLGRAVFAGRAIVGTIFAPEVNLPTGRERFVSPGERFYSGGPNSVRGFSQNQLGPQVKVIQEIRTDNLGRTDSIIRTSAVGGDGLVVLNAELRIPLTTDGVIATGIFVDAGRVTRRTDEGVGLVATPGVGIRIQSPIGPVRFDIGYNPQRESTSPLFARSGDELVTVDPAYRTTSSFFERLRFHFAVGQAF